MRVRLYHTPRRNSPMWRALAADIARGLVQLVYPGACLACDARLGPYEGVRRDIVLKMKHGHHDGLAEAVGELWAAHAADRLRELGADAVVPVPLHWRRRWRRGYNQAEALSAALASALHIACR